MFQKTEDRGSIQVQDSQTCWCGSRFCVQELEQQAKAVAVTAQKVSHWFYQCDLKRFDR
jgi:hypothetical protein